MQISKVYERRSFFVIAVYMLFLSAVLCGGTYYLINWFLSVFSMDSGKELLLENIPVWAGQLDLISQNFYVWVVPGIMGGCLFLGGVGWLLLKIFMSSAFNQMNVQPAVKPEKKATQKDFIDHWIEQERKRRLFLHTLSILQREGRLLDFFEEDLSLYEDEQIGAAVRSIQEDCKRAVKKYIDPKPVIDSKEGETVTIEPGFDMDSVSLVGNVTGEPPFEGILRHRGWRAGKKEIPSLLDIQDSSIMTPAEVEI